MSSMLMNQYILNEVSLHIKQGYVLVSWWKCDQRLAGTYLCVSSRPVIRYLIIKRWLRLFLEPNHMNIWESAVHIYVHRLRICGAPFHYGILIDTIWPLFPLLILWHKSLLQPNWQSFFSAHNSFQPSPIPTPFTLTTLGSSHKDDEHVSQVCPITNPPTSRPGHLWVVDTD